MPKCSLSFQENASGLSAHAAPIQAAASGPALPLADLAYYADGWLVDGEIRQHSPRPSVSAAR